MTAESPIALSSSTIWKSSLESIEYRASKTATEFIKAVMVFAELADYLSHRPPAPYLYSYYFFKKNLKFNLIIVLQEINE